MDGNRRWAKKRFMPTALGHAAGAKQVRDIVKTCAEIGVPYLSLFAFSTENWKRPEDEVSSLMGLFATYLQKEVDDMNTNGVCLKVVGDKSRFAPVLQELSNLKAGQTVFLKHTALAGMEGFVQSVSSKRVAVLLEILGRPTLVQLEHHQVELSQ